MKRRYAICLAAAGFWCLFNANSGLARQPDQTSAVKQLETAVKHDPDLHGVWVQLNPEGNNGRYRASITVDKSRAAAQLAATRALLNNILGDKYDIEPKVKELPLTELLADLQNEIDMQPALAGSVIKDAYYKLRGKTPGKADKLILVLRGRIPQTDGAALQITGGIVKECKKLLEKSKDWPGINEEIPAYTPNPEGLEEVRGSGAAAVAFFNRGIDQYVRNDFSGAAKSFSSAIVEDPSWQQCRYWRIAAEIAAGRTELAYRLLRPLLQAERLNSPYQHRWALAVALERVQGPVRATLEGLKFRAWEDVEIGLPPDAVPSAAK